jgi:hypothetical protein
MQGSTYTGEWKDGHQEGWGIYRWPSGSLYMVRHFFFFFFFFFSLTCDYDRERGRAGTRTGGV